MTRKKPLEIRVTVALEGNRMGEVISSEPNDDTFSALSRSGKIWACGADTVNDSALGIYKKTFDRSYFDSGKAVRELAYKKI